MQIIISTKILQKKMFPKEIIPIKKHIIEKKFYNRI
jgi:hypothetical protein